MSSKPTGRARRALKEMLDARKGAMDAPPEPVACVNPAPPTGPVAGPFRQEASAQAEQLLSVLPTPAPQPVPHPVPLKPPLAAPLPPAPVHPLRRPELDAWTSPTAPAPSPTPAESVHPTHHLRPEQWLLLELITTGMNAASGAQDAYDSVGRNLSNPAHHAVPPGD